MRKRWKIIQGASIIILFILGMGWLTVAMRRMNLDQRGPEREAIDALKTLRLAVVEYHYVNRRWPAKLEDGLMSLRDRPMKEPPPLPLADARWGYRAADGHVFIDSPHTDSRGNAWKAY